MTAEAHPPVISVMLAVPDAAAAARWYGQALGATKLWDLGGVVGLTVAGAPFFPGEPENNGWDFPAALGSRTVRVEVFADDPDAFIERAVAAGANGRVDKIRDHEAPGAFTGEAALSTRSATCGWPVTGPRWGHITCPDAAGGEWACTRPGPGPDLSRVGAVDRAGAVDTVAT